MFVRNFALLYCLHLLTYKKRNSSNTVWYVMFRLHSSLDKDVHRILCAPQRLTGQVVDLVY